MALPTSKPGRTPAGDAGPNTGTAADTGTAPEAGADPAPGQDTDLGWSLAVLLRRWHERVEAVLDGVPHGSRGYHVLTAVSLDEPPTQAALAERLLIDRSVMTYLLDDLEEAGLVRRRVDPGDRRVRRVCATAHGHEVLASLSERVREAEEHVLAGLDPPARELFRRIAQLAAVSVQESSPTTDPCAAVRRVVGPDDPGGRPVKREGRRGRGNRAKRE
ncbi:winged helix-turn-helix transcriptional regulator [Nocardiopsis akebiae]|uniref:Winged helix-turn-helix transcriptional regulator n=1 Tax=Nocardiopsis akebiae TaxID=2831968 RepID=A0ABX8C9I8_9ACTN|nr:MarR family winged helix-turn-helix transcriptional regulator [Nocardiopsis akebiae]QUX31096.1 winged helix-turn-helix transcriptional regulator [Nocardiopsis akebiae]